MNFYISIFFILFFCIPRMAECENKDPYIELVSPLRFPSAFADQSSYITLAPGERGSAVFSIKGGKPLAPISITIKADKGTPIYNVRTRECSVTVSNWIIRGEKNLDENGAATIMVGASVTIDAEVAHLCGGQYMGSTILSVVYGDNGQINSGGDNGQVNLGK